MSELNFSLINEKQMPKNFYNKSWGLQQNLFKSLEPDIIENNSLDDLGNNFDFFKSKKTLFPYIEDDKFDYIREDVEFSFYDNLLIKYKEENKKHSKNKKKTIKREEIKSANGEKLYKEGKVKKSKDRDLNNIGKENESIKREPSPKKEIVLNNEVDDKNGLKNLKVYFKLPQIEIQKTISEDKIISTFSPNIPSTKTGNEKPHDFRPNQTNRKQSTSRNLSSGERFNNFFPKEILDVPGKYTPSRFKKSFFESKHNSKKMDSKEKRTPKQSGINKNLKQSSVIVEKENIVASVSPTKFSKKTSNSKNSKKIFTSELNGNSVNNEDNNLVIVASYKEEEKKKKKNFFTAIFCLPFCKK